MSNRPLKFVHPASLLALATGAAIALASAAGPALAQSSTNSRSITSTTSGGNTIRVESDGSAYTVTLNGKQISKGAITDKTWKSFEVADENGAKIGEIIRNGPDFTVTMTGDESEDESDWAPAQSLVGLANLADLERRLAQAGQSYPDAARAYARASTPPRTMLGVNLENPSEAMASQLGIDRENTTILSSVNEGFPADKAGLRQFDIITEVDGKPASPDQLRKALREKNPGDTLSFKIVRGQERKDITVNLEAYDAGRLGTTAWNVTGGAGPSWGGPGTAFTFLDDARTEELAREMEKLARELETTARSAAEKAQGANMGALEELSRQMEGVSKQLAERAEQMAQERATAGLGTTAPGVRIIGRRRGGQGDVFVAPTAPVPPMLPINPAGPGAAMPPIAPMAPMSPGGSPADVQSLKQRMDAIDQRLATLTELLEKAVSQKGASAGP
ncbi:MAG: PDZ domain-containing protein [Phycisphaerales bacterium]